MKIFLSLQKDLLNKIKMRVIVSFKKQLKGIAAIALLILFCFFSSFSCNKSEDKNPTDPQDTMPDSTLTHKDVDVWLTNADKSSLLRQSIVGLNFSNSTNTFSTIEIDTTQLFQVMDGFGFSLTGGSAYVINKLEQSMRESVIRELFSSDSGCIGLSYIRISIGASDLDATVFSYDDMPIGQTDPGLYNFSLDKDKENLIPVLKRALFYNPGLKILGSPWSAPVWMKTNQSSIGGSLKTEYYDSYSKYFVKYIQQMNAEGIPIDAITIQNEPLNPNNNPSMSMSWQEQRDFIKNFLGPAFDQASIKTKILLYDHNCDRPDYPTSILNDAATAKYIDGSAFHLYGGDISALSQVHQAHPDKNVYFTEQWVGGPSNFGPDMKWHIQNLIIGAPRNWSKNVLEWNLASDPYYEPHTSGGCDRCEGALTIASGSVYRNVSYYIIAHASKFVKSGAVRIASNIPEGLPNISYINPDGTKVLIVLNNGNKQSSFNIKSGNRKTIAKLDAGSVGTYVWK